MSDDGDHARQAREESGRRARRAVGLKVIRETREWAEDVEREAAERPRLVWKLVVIVAVVTAIVVLAL